MNALRSSRPRSVLLGAAAALAGLLAAPAAHAAPVTGVTIAPIRAAENRVEMVRDLDEARALGAKVVRTEIRWDLLEPTQGTYDAAYLARLDDVFAAAKARGIRVLVTFLGSPCWTSTAPQLTAGCSGTVPQDAPFHPPSDPAAYGRAAAFLAQRFTGTLGWIEIWNEPDHANQVYWGGADKARTYAGLLKASYPLIRAAAPDVKVLGGAIVGANGAFLKALYANGAKGSYDALSVHYYDLVLASIRAIRETQRAAGDRAPLFLGEFGWTSCRPKSTEGGHACVTQGVQAANLRDTFRLLRSASYVQGALVYNLRDTAQYRFGLLSTTQKRKLAFAAARTAFGGGGTAARVTLRLRRSGGTVIASGSGPAGDALGLEVRQGGRLRYTATLRQARDRSYRVRLPRQLGTRGLQVRVRQFWSGSSATKRI
ncbi:cellulase family glycosylhydrolase [Paraconexibacter algicola]|uniref:Glycoside hydrolase family 5 domain-containing protein n=1 Tax=Paraconexibacter algicola TaxID=2133960 RepID=A0A2T4UGV5_9ACTN|nr:cellulase family glycosylhydrolase [Paraconexibacter algicola]PTL58483.1 hypothetical protein C7Y72_01840 [Paraconexibacter algicola]